MMLDYAFVIALFHNDMGPITDVGLQWIVNKIIKKTLDFFGNSVNFPDFVHTV